MKQYFKSIMVVSLLLLLSMALVGVASADVIRGVGWLKAQGSGIARLRMSGEVEITGHGASIVTIRGAEHIEATGQRINRNDGVVVFRGYEGRIKVTGRNMVIIMTGRKIDFTAKGKGTAFLRGHGRYETRGFSGDWAAGGLGIEVVEE